MEPFERAVLITHDTFLVLTSNPRETGKYMKNTKLWSCFCLCLAVLESGCASGHSSNVASISPSAVALAPGQSVQFQATLPGNAKSIAWSVNGISGGNGMLGTIDASG